MNVTLKPELETLIAAEVKAGRSADPDYFLNKAAYHYVLRRDLGQEYSPEEIDRIICKGLEDLDRGDMTDGQEAFRQLRALSGSATASGSEQV